MNENLILILIGIIQAFFFFELKRFENEICELRKLIFEVMKFSSEKFIER